MIQSKLTTESKFALLLTEEALRRFTNLVNFNGATVYLKAKCSDGVDRQFPDLEALLAYENPNKRKITHITILAESEKGYQQSGEAISVEVRLGDLSWRTMQITVWGEDKFVTKTGDDLRELGIECRPWYWPCHAIDFLKLSFYICIATGLIGTALLTFMKFSASGIESLTIFASIKAFAAGIFYGILLNLMFLLLGKLRDFVFPRVVFEIGQQKRKEAILEKVRWTVVIGSLAALGRAAFLATFR